MDIKKEVKAYVDHQKKLVILKYVRDCGCVNKTLKDFRIPKSTYYKWKKAFDKGGAEGLLRKPPVPNTHPKRISQEIAEKVLSLRSEYQMGS